VRANPYALPHDRYATFLRDLERDFGVTLRADADTPSGVLTPQPAAPRQPSPLRFAGRMKAIEMPPAAAYPSLPPSSSSSSCSSASSSSSASPQTPCTSLSPASVFMRQLHAHVVASDAKTVSSMDRVRPVISVQHGDGR
jgi:hypothetical protein